LKFQGTQEDKDKLGYQAIKKLHEKMDDDRDGQVEIQETKEVRLFNVMTAVLRTQVFYGC
jgi:hypothetical protein